MPLRAMLCCAGFRVSPELSWVLASIAWCVDQPAAACSSTEDMAATSHQAVLDMLGELCQCPWFGGEKGDQPGDTLHSSIPRGGRPSMQACAECCPGTKRPVSCSMIWQVLCRWSRPGQTCASSCICRHRVGAPVCLSPCAGAMIVAAMTPSSPTSGRSFHRWGPW